MSNQLLNGLDTLRDAITGNTIESSSDNNKLLIGLGVVSLFVFSPLIFLLLKNRPQLFRSFLGILLGLFLGWSIANLYSGMIIFTFSNIPFSTALVDVLFYFFFFLLIFFFLFRKKIKDNLFPVLIFSLCFFSISILTMLSAITRHNILFRY